MKTPNENGNGTLKKRGNGRKITLNKKQEAQLARAIAKVTKTPRYGQVYFDQPGQHYALTDPATPPVNDGGLVKMDLSSKNATDTVNFTYAHIEDMTGNDNFLDPQPPATDFKTLADQFAAATTAQTNAANAAKEATNLRDSIWKQLLQAFQVRGAYVQQASNGNSDVILSSGLGLRNPRTPTGDLPAPTSITAVAGATSGKIILSWPIVAKARGYTLQVSDAATEARDWKLLDMSNRGKYEASGLVPGSKNAFRVACNGGTSGMSAWSFEIVRTVV